MSAADLGIGLAGGIDKDGSRAAELLAAGFASIEFGSVAAGIAGYPDAGAAVLAERLGALAALADERPRPAPSPRIGVGVSRPPGAPSAALADCWLAALEALAGVADYVSFNLSAAANRPLLAAEQRPLLARSFATVAAWRDVSAAAGGRRLDLAVKLPLGALGELLPSAALLAAAAGFDQLTVVRADDDAGFSRLTALDRHLHGGLPLVVVGGIRSAADVGAARAAGAAGVQVHRLFVEQGVRCVETLCPSA
ncbi:MAG: dihydroorotate dehydrogenase [Rhodocyclales bacterium]|nr:dihydroorotate dehydrogenase [Rhodocyclales bacterium]